MPDRLRYRVWFRRAIALTLGVLAVFAAVAGLSADPLETGNKLASIGGLIVGAAGLIVTILSLASGVREIPCDEVAMAEDLAIQVRRQWQREKHLRRLDGADLIPVAWYSTTVDVAASPADVLAGAVAGRPTRLRLGGAAADLGETFRKLPRRRLVVLGEPGSGKSTLLLNLTIELLELRSTSEAVPVLLNLSSWDPREDMESWLVRRLAEEYPNVGSPEGYSRLVYGGRILPVLDGLDEISDDSRATALTSLGLFAATGQTFVISCRSADYARLIASTGRPVPGAAVVEIDSLTTEVVTSYLSGPRWRAVRESLTSHPVVRTALQTPLMLHLARTVYASPGTNPEELLDTRKFARSEDVEDHLISAYLPAVYKISPSRQAPAAAVGRLTYLAKHAAENIAWWNLHDAVVRWPIRSAALTSVVVVLVLGLPTSLSFGRVTGLWYAFVPTVAIIVGFVRPVLSSGGARVPLVRSLLCIGLPAAGTALVVNSLGLGLGAATNGLVGLPFDRAFYIHFVWIGLGYLAGFEFGQSMRALASVPRALSVGVITRALVSCALIAAFYPPHFYSDDVEAIPAVMIMLFIVSAFGCFLQALVASVRVSFLSHRSVHRADRSGAPSAVMVGTAIALYSFSTPTYETMYLVLLYIPVAALPTWFITGTFSEYRPANAADARRKAQPITRALIVCVLVFVVVTVFVIVGSVFYADPVSEYLPSALATGAISGIMAAVLGLSSAYLTTPARDLDQTDPRIALRRDRGAALVILASTPVMTVLLSEVASPLRLSVIVLCLLLLAANSRWPAYVGARTLLWLYRALPWRVTDFLADAHDRGVLRRTGSVYQFRHARIRDSLARSSPVKH
jgi:hypothetical protein